MISAYRGLTEFDAPRVLNFRRNAPGLVGEPAGVGDGVTDNAPGLLRVAEHHPADREVFFEKGVYRVASSVTIPNPVAFEKGARLDIPAGVTVTFAGGVKAGLHQVFEGAGKVVFAPGSIDYAYPQWWGAKGAGNAAYDDSPGIQAAINSGARVQVPGGTYTLHSQLRASAGDLDLTGVAGGKTRLRFASAVASNTHLILVESFTPDYLKNIKISDLSLDGYGDAYKWYGIQINRATSVRVENIESAYLQGTVGALGATFLTFKGIRATDQTESVSLQSSIIFKVEDVTAYGVDEIVDLWNCEIGTISQVVGKQRASQILLEAEAFDFSASRKITITGAVVDGFGRGINFKQENTTPLPAVGNVSVTGCTFTGFKVAGIYVVAGGPGQDAPSERLRISDSIFHSAEAGSIGFWMNGLAGGLSFKDTRVADCTFDAVESAVKIGYYPDVRFTNCTLRSLNNDAVSITNAPNFKIAGGEVYATNNTANTYAIRAVASHGVKIQAVDVTSENSTAIYLDDCARPSVVGCEEIYARLRGIYALFTTAVSYSATNRTLGFKFNRNTFRRWGVATANTAAVHVKLAATITAGGVLRQFSVSNNEFTLDPDVALNTQAAMYFECANGSLDYGKLVGNQAVPCYYYIFPNETDAFVPATANVPTSGKVHKQNYS